jgi:hypothetical protein
MSKHPLTPTAHATSKTEIQEYHLIALTSEVSKAEMLLLLMEGLNGGFLSGGMLFLLTLMKIW